MIIEFLCKYGKEISLADTSDEGSKSKSRGSKPSGKYEYIITSEANMDDQPSKKRCVCGAPSMVGTMSHKSTATTATSDFAQQTQPPCSCGIAQKQRSQTQPVDDGKCSCGAGAKEKSQQQLQPKDAPSCGICGSQKQQPSQAQMQRSQQKVDDDQCTCSRKEALHQSQSQQQRTLGIQHDPDCPCAGPQQKGAGLIVVQGQVPDTDPDCECSMDERQKQQMEQQQKQQDCMRQQQQQQQEHQKQQQQLQSEQQQDCTTKPQTQDCSQHLKKSNGGCGCQDDEDEDRHDALTGHYFPVADKDPDDDYQQESKSTQRQSGCDGCGRDDCPDPPQEDCGCSPVAKPQQTPIAECAPQPKAPQPAAADDCSCAVGKSQSKAASVAPPPTFICPHCGGVTSEAFLSTHTIGTNRTMGPQDDCGAAGQPLRGLASKGIQSGHSKVAAGGAGAECAPCKAHVTADFPAGHGPKPLFNKQFPLADPASNFDACPPKRGSDATNNKKKKCCNCDEKEDGE